MSMVELIDQLTELVKAQADIIKEQSYIISQHGIETELDKRLGTVRDAGMETGDSEHTADYKKERR